MPLTGTPSGTGISISCSLSSPAGSGFSLVALVSFDSFVALVSPLVSFGFFDVFSVLVVFGDGAGVPCCAAIDPNARVQASARLRDNFATDAGEQTEQTWKRAKRDLIGAIGKSFCGVLMRLDKDSVATCGDGGASQDRRQFAVTGGAITCSARTLLRVRCVEDYRII